MHLDVFCLQYCKRKEKEISAKICLKTKNLLDLFDQFVSMAESEIDIIMIWFALIVILCVCFF